MLRRVRKHMKIGFMGKLLISYFLIITISVVLLTTFFLYTVEKIITQQIISSNVAMLEQVNKNITTVINQIVTIISIYYNYSDLEQYLTAQNTEPFERLRNIEFIQNKITNSISTIQHLKSSIIIIGANMEIYYIDMGEIIEKDRLIEIAADCSSLKTNNIIWYPFETGFVEHCKGKHVICAVKSMDGGVLRQPYGVILVQMEEELLNSIYKDSLIKGNTFYIIDRDGRVISSNNRKTTGEELFYDNIQLLTNKDNMVIRNIKIENKKNMLISQKIPIVEWYIVEVISYESILSALYSLRYYLIPLTASLVIIAFAASFIIIRRLTYPIKILSNGMMEVQKGNFSVQLYYDGENELRVLIDVFNSMTVQLDNYLKNYLREQDEKKRAEYMALQAQINPHFLYNTLDSVKALVWTGNSRLVDSTITALVKLLKKTIGSPDEMVTIADEIESVRNYVQLQNIRYGDKVELNIYIEPKIAECKILKLIMQPVVENSIIHGISPMEGKGIISIYIMPYGRDIRIEIIDNGIGMNQSKLVGILGETPKDKNFGGIGLGNVDKRLKLFFGLGYGIQINSKENIGTQVIITHPMIVAEGDGDDEKAL